MFFIHFEKHSVVSRIKVGFLSLLDSKLGGNAGICVAWMVARLLCWYLARIFSEKLAHGEGLGEILLLKFPLYLTAKPSFQQYFRKFQGNEHCWHIPCCRFRVDRGFLRPPPLPSAKSFVLDLDVRWALMDESCSQLILHFTLGIFNC